MTETGEKNRGNTGRVRIVAIGASAGGTEALHEILPALPEGFPCVVVVQHILPGFVRLLCADIGRKCRMRACVAEDGDPVEDGKIYFANDGRQLLVKRERDALTLRLGGRERVGGHCPSADALFHSVSECAASEAVGVILTGMGADGAEGLLSMRGAGAYTIGQDETSSAIYGMPRAAFEKGAVVRQVPLQLIAAELIRRAR